MKSSYVIGVAIATAVIGLFVWHRDSTTIPADVSSKLVQSTPISAKTQTAQPGQPASPKPVLQLVGLLNQGASASALIQVRGARAQLFRLGDMVTEEWKLESVGTDHAMVGNATQRFRYELESGQQVAAESSERESNRRVPAIESPKADPMLGPPVAVLSDDVARQRNQEFLEALRQRSKSP